MNSIHKASAAFPWINTSLATWGPSALLLLETVASKVLNLSEIALCPQEKIMRPCSTICHFEMASLGSRVVAPERRTIANSQVKTFYFTIRCFLWSKVSTSIVKCLFLKQAFWEYNEFDSNKYLYPLWNIWHKLNLNLLTRRCCCSVN